MPYKYSSIDKNNLDWFPKDDTKATLLKINLYEGHIRGLYNFELNFKYPISVIAGKNGSGKSTILALAACAFHNFKDGFKILGRKNTYYTFSNFFIQSKEEIPPEGITIRYQILHNNWHNIGKGPAWQTRKKNIGGKWNKYSSRVKRNVVFFGIDRVVPHSEKSVSISYSRYFRDSEKLGWEKKVKNLVGKILSKNYDDFWYKKHTKYRLPVVKLGNNIYSGFNMGAGENALFEIFSTIFSCPPGVLLVIDEIELGLHEEAQTKFIVELKKLCRERQIQIICTTHSSNILKCVPPEARFFIESFEKKTIITPDISYLFAAGKMSGENSNELDIFIEDSIAKYLLEFGISYNTRVRVNFLQIGSSSAIARQLSARYKNIKEGKCIAILDGDQSSKIEEICDIFLRLIEKVEDKESAKLWIQDRLNFLPGDNWPENWVLSEIKQNNKSELMQILSLDEHELNELIDESIRADKHNEFYTLAKKMNFEKDYIRNVFCNVAIKFNIEKFEEIDDFILSHLD